MSLRERIWEAVLTSAMSDLNGPSEQEIRDYIFCVKEDARQWFNSDSEETGSFLWVCFTLGLDPSAVRRRVEELKNE